jgi:hypothetical protein
MTVRKQAYDRRPEVAIRRKTMQQDYRVTVPALAGRVVVEATGTDLDELSPHSGAGQLSKSDRIHLSLAYLHALSGVVPQSCYRYARRFRVFVKRCMSLHALHLDR